MLGPDPGCLAQCAQGRAHVETVGVLGSPPWLFVGPLARRAVGPHEQHRQNETSRVPTRGPLTGQGVWQPTGNLHPAGGTIGLPEPMGGGAGPAMLPLKKRTLLMKRRRPWCECWLACWLRR